MKKIANSIACFRPKELLLRHICQLYKVSEHWLETGEGERFDSCLEEIGKLEEALDIFKTLRPEFQDDALEQIKSLVELQEKKPETQQKIQTDNNDTV